jgi:hypothetical protein
LLISVYTIYIVIVEDIGLHAAEEDAAESMTLPMIVLILPDSKVGVGALASIGICGVCQVIVNTLGLSLASGRTIICFFSLLFLIIHAQFKTLAEI